MQTPDTKNIEDLMVRFRDGKVDLATVKKELQEYLNLDFRFAPGIRIIGKTLDGIVEIVKRL